MSATADDRMNRSTNMELDDSTNDTPSSTTPSPSISPSPSPSSSSTPPLSPSSSSLSVAFPPPLFAESHNRAELTKRPSFKLPNAWITGFKRAPAMTAPTKKKEKKDDGDEAKEKASSKEKSDSGGASKEKDRDADREKRRREKEKEQQREKERYQRLIPEAGMTLKESFESLVTDILHGGKSLLAASSSHATSTSPRAQELIAQRSWDVPYLSYFLWLFHKPLNLRPIEPYRLEQMILQPQNVLYDSLFSELASKLLFATRLNFTSHYKKSMTFMGRNQRCFQYDVICDWMCILLDLWIQQSIQRKKAEEEDDEEEEEDEDEKEEESVAASRKRKKGKNENDSDSELSDEEDTEEREAFNLHLVPERKWRPDMEELFSNINPFTVDESNDSSNATASSSSSNSTSTANDSVSSDGVTSNASAPSGPTVPIRRKLFHQLSFRDRVTVLRLLCDFQLYANPNVQTQLKSHDSKDLRLDPVGTDSTGKRFFWFGYPDYRIYVQGTPEVIKVPKTSDEVEKEKREEEEFKKAVAEEIARLEEKEKEKDKAKSDKSKKAKERELTAKALAMDEDEPLSLLISPSPPTANGASENHTDMNSNHSNGTTNTANTTSSSSSASSASATSPSLNKFGLPFTIVEELAEPSKPRQLCWTEPDQPPFSLLTSNADQLRTLIARMKKIDHPRNIELTKNLTKVLNDIEEGRGPVSIEDEDDKNKRSSTNKKESIASKRVSDRLVTLEAAREEAERMRMVRAEEESRQRYTRRNRWLDEMSLRNLVKVRRAYEKFMGIEHERKAKEDETSSGTSSSSSESETDDEDETASRSKRSSRSTRATKRRKTNANGSRTTRNRGRSSKNLTESDTETEGEEEESESEEEEDEDDEGCTVCGTITPPADNSNPIIFCDKCDLQYCMKCIPLDAVPEGDFICPKCESADSEDKADK